MLKHKSHQLTRLAPTPSGYLHIGNVFSFAITAALAREKGADVLLRIDDLDSLRVSPDYVRDIFETLRFLDIPWNRGPKDEPDFFEKYSQHTRTHLYQAALADLRARDLVYACECTRKHTTKAGTCVQGCRDKDLSLDAPEMPWRLKTGREVVLMNTLQGIREERLPLNMTDFIVRRKDGLPSYQLASLTDDVHFGVDLIVRGVDLIDSTIAQLVLASRLNLSDFMSVSFVHHGLIKDPRGAKLSKSAGSTSIKWLRAQGKTPQSVYELMGEAIGQDFVLSWESLNLGFLG